MIWLLVLAMLGEPAMKPEAKRHLDAGLRAFAVQDYAQAISEFQAGFEIDPRREFLYALGQAERMSGDCEKAIRSYDAFLLTNPPDRQAEPARQNLKRCKDELAAKTAPAPPKPEPAPEPMPQPVVTPVAPPPPRPIDKPWYADAWGDALVVGGTVTLVVGGLVWSGAQDDIAAAHATMSYPDFAAHADGAETRQTIGVVTMIAGGALVAGGVVRYWLRPRVSIAPMAGAGVMVVGNF
jgi:tetratricopeptide (TPR) repeat protein